MEKYQSIDEYIHLQSVEVQPILRKIRAVLKEALPHAKEKIAYGMPTFYDQKNLIHFAVFKHHIGLYPGGAYTNAHLEELRSYKVTKGSIHFPKVEPLDYDLIRSIARWCDQHQVNHNS